MIKMKQSGLILIAMWVCFCGQVFAQEATPVNEEASELKKSLEHSKKTIRELNSKVVNLEQQIFNLLSGDFDTEAKKILDKQFEAEHNQLIGEASALKTKVKTLTEDLESKGKSIEKLAGQKKTLIQQVRKYKSEYARRTSELKIAQAKGEQSERLAASKTQASSEQLRSKLENLSKQLNFANDENEQKSQAIRRLNQKNAQLTDDLYANALELRKVKDQIAQLQKRPDGAGAGDIKKTNEKDSEVVLNQKIQKLTDQLAESQKRNELLQANAKLLNDKAQEVQQPVAQDQGFLEKRIADLESQIQLHERFSQEKTSQLAELQRTNQWLNNSLKKKMDQWVAAEKMLEDLRNSKKTINDQLVKTQAEVKSANEQIDNMKSKSSENNQLRESLQSQINQLKQERLTMETEMASIKSQTQAAEKKYQELMNGRSALEKKQNSQEEFLKQKDQKIAVISTENKVLQEKVKTAQRSLEDISVENKERQARLEELDKRILDSRKDIEKVLQTNKELEKDLAISNQKWEQLNASVSKTVEDAKKELEHKVNALTAELASAQEQLKAKNAELELAVKQKEHMVKSAGQFLQKVNSLDKTTQE